MNKAEQKAWMEEMKGQWQNALERNEKLLKWASEGKLPLNAEEEAKMKAQSAQILERIQKFDELIRAAPAWSIEELAKQMESHFANTTKEQLEKDLEEAGCAHMFEDADSLAGSAEFVLEAQKLLKERANAFESRLLGKAVRFWYAGEEREGKVAGISGLLPDFSKANVVVKHQEEDIKIQEGGWHLYFKTDDLTEGRLRLLLKD